MSEQDNIVDDDFGFQVGDLPRLSKVATEFVRHHRSEARIAVVAALEAVAVRFETTHRIPADDLPDALKPYVLRKATTSDLIGVSDAAARLAVSQSTVYD